MAEGFCQVARVLFSGNFASAIKPSRKFLNLQFCCIFSLFHREIFEVLDLMKMDMANFTIQQIRPYIQQQSVEYERKKFQEFLKTQQGTVR